VLHGNFDSTSLAVISRRATCINRLLSCVCAKVQHPQIEQNAQKVIFINSTIYKPTMASVFENAIAFMEKLGLFRVVLPFLLVYTIVFAILEKTKVLGTEKISDKEVTKKSLNSLVSFCIAFFVIASSELVALINKSIAQIVILLFVGVFFLLLIGVFFKNGEDVFLTGKWRMGAMMFMLIGILFVFAQNIDYKGKSLVDWVWFHLSTNYNSGVVSGLLLVAIIAGVMYYVSGSSDQKPAEKKESK
jgi:hypothetical protein